MGTRTQCQWGVDYRRYVRPYPIPAHRPMEQWHVGPGIGRAWATLGDLDFFPLYCTSICISLAQVFFFSEWTLLYIHIHLFGSLLPNSANTSWSHRHWLWSFRAVGVSDRDAGNSANAAAAAAVTIAKRVSHGHGSIKHYIASLNFTFGRQLLVAAIFSSRTRVSVYFGRCELVIMGFSSQNMDWESRIIYPIVS